MRLDTRVALPVYAMRSPVGGIARGRCSERAQQAARHTACVLQDAVHDRARRCGTMMQYTQEYSVMRCIMRLDTRVAPHVCMRCTRMWAALRVVDVASAHNKRHDTPRAYSSTVHDRARRYAVPYHSIHNTS